MQYCMYIPLLKDLGTFVDSPDPLVRETATTAACNISVIYTEDNITQSPTFGGEGEGGAEGLTVKGGELVERERSGWTPLLPEFLHSQ